jgi:hypothetical protein
MVCWKHQGRVMLRALEVLIAKDLITVTMVQVKGNYTYRLSSHNSHMSDACNHTVLMSASAREVLGMYMFRPTRSRSIMKANKESKHAPKHCDGAG